MHKCSPALAHRDIKPHNVLLQRHQHRDSEAAVPVGTHSHPGDDLEAQPLHAVGAAPAASSYHAVVMDFGSCQEARINVSSRAQALAVQEDAEVSFAPGIRLHLHQLSCHFRSAPAVMLLSTINACFQFGCAACA